MSGSSAIKGGGRAAMSDAAEDAVVSLLLSLRNNTKDMTAMSDHERKREHKRFLKQLVEQYERITLQEQFNQGTASKTTTTTTVSSSVATTKDRDTSSAVIVDGNSTKVRIELVEALFSTDSTSKKKKDNTKSSSSSSSSSSVTTATSKKSKNNSKDNFKVGTKKPMVLLRSTTVDELLKQAKNKLRLKQQPIRCFVVSEKTKTEVDLVGDLRGVKDGTKLYVTTTSSSILPPTTIVPSTNNETKVDETETNKSDKGHDMAMASPVVEDPLDAVKQAYAKKRRRQNRQESSSRRQQFSEEEAQPHPRFADHFDKLPPLSPHRATLPAASCRETLLSSVDTSRVVIVCGATGCGKSSQVPQYLLEGMQAANQIDDAYILVTQPRRVAATSLAHRVAWEMSSTPPGRPGSIVGYNIRLDRAIADETTKIVYCTVGILLRMLTSPPPQPPPPRSDKNRDSQNSTVVDDSTTTHQGSRRHIPLSHISHVVIDEVHERDLSTDFALTLMKYVLSVNPHIRIILMSATASADLFVRYFEGNGTNRESPTVLTIPGRSFPVDIKWIGDCQRFASRNVQGWTEDIVEDKIPVPGREKSEDEETSVTVQLSPRATAKIDNLFLKSLIQSIVQQQQQEQVQPTTVEEGRRVRTNGAILVFLPGKAEIESLARVLRNDNDDDESGSYGNNHNSGSGAVRIYKLHSTIPRQEQQAVFQPALEGTVKIVLATNIAETSITISDVSHVIDTGRVKESRFNASSRIKELVTVWTSQASAKQRAGRAGRTSRGVCWRLFSEPFGEKYMPLQTPPEILRTPLDELVLQVCLLYEQRRDEAKQQTPQEQHQQRPTPPAGVSPIRILSRTPEPPPNESLIEACNHLLEVGAVHTVGSQEVDDATMYRLTPLGYHLSRLPMDAKVGKVLIVGCILECLDGALTVAATLSHTKSCFPSQRWSSCTAADWKQALEARNRLVVSGFGGQEWKGGTVKGDLIACIAAYNEWSVKKGYKERIAFCNAHALDNAALNDIAALRDQFKDCLVDAGFLKGKSGGGGGGRKDYSFCNTYKDDALLTSCCLVAGLYPNICTLLRPRKGKGGSWAGKLLTKDGDTCLPSFSSFQKERVQSAAESGKDAYAVYHAKHRTLGTATTNSNSQQQGQVHLSQVNFVSRYALLLFGGELEIRGNAIVVDGWLKFKVGKSGTATAILLLELRSELDKVLLRRITSGGGDEEEKTLQAECQKILEVVRTLLGEES